MSLLQHSKGYQNGWGIKMASFLSFENLTFWYPFVLVPVWVPPNLGRNAHSWEHAFLNVHSGILKQQREYDLFRQQIKQFVFVLSPAFVWGKNFGDIKKGVGNGKGDIRICLPVHCLSARSDRQPYCHTNATSSPC